MLKKENESKTSKKILKASQKLFLESGFSGTSIRGIAEKAGVPISLIYHYFKNKEVLWKSVKRQLLEEHLKKLPEQQSDDVDFKTYLQQFLSIRFNFYDQNPYAARLISWQRLEKFSDDLSGVQTNSLSFDIQKKIIHYQNLGQVKKEIDPELFSYLIINTITLPFYDKSSIFSKNEDLKKQQYVNHVINIFEQHMAHSPEKENS